MTAPCSKLRIGAGALAVLAVVGACTAAGGGDEPNTSPTEADSVNVRVPKRAWRKAACALPVEYVERVRRGYFRGRSPDIAMIPKEPNFFGGFTTTSHSGPWAYVQDVPLVFYGPGFIRRQGDIAPEREITLADLAPTLGELLEVPWPEHYAGRSISEALVPAVERPEPPRVVVAIAWDGGGWNVLNEWPDTWPHLARMMRRGTSVTNAIVGSSPSVTPAAHANMGTGTFPRQHGIIDIPLRDGNQIVGSYSGRTPKYMEVPTLGDLHDANTNNEAKVGVFSYKSWHWGMMGHGSYLEGGDKDIAVLAERSAGELETNPEWYSLPPYLSSVGGFEEDVQEVDLDDGQLDNTWMGHEILDDPNLLRETPAWVLYQTRLITTLLETEGFGADDIPDIFFTNYKQIDEIGHSYNMLGPEMPEIIRYSDDALKDLEDFLDAEVGENRWVIAITADHGQTPNAIDTGAWPIRMVPMTQDVADHFGVDVEELFDEERVTGVWLNRQTLKAEGITTEEISDFLMRYTIKENNPRGAEIPQKYMDRLDETLFEAVFPGSRLGEVWRCVNARA